jgi:hypothetical protein
MYTMGSEALTAPWPAMRPPPHHGRQVSTSVVRRPYEYPMYGEETARGETRKMDGLPRLGSADPRSPGKSGRLRVGDVECALLLPIPPRRPVADRGRPRHRLTDSWRKGRRSRILLGRSVTFSWARRHARTAGQAINDAMKAIEEGNWKHSRSRRPPPGSMRSRSRLRLMRQRWRTDAARRLRRARRHDWAGAILRTTPVSPNGVPVVFPST